jgi:stage II sporulation protein D
MKNNWPRAAYGAQAILARSFALKYLEENDTNTISGSYKYAQEYKPENITDNITSGVSATRGEVAKYDDKYIKGWFHSSAGGQTTTAKIGLAYEKDEPPYTVSVESSDEESPADIKDWEVTFTKNEIETVLKKMGEDIGDLEDIKIVKRDKTGRVIEFNFIGSDKSVEIMAANFRTELDPKRLKSIKIKSNSWLDTFAIRSFSFKHSINVNSSPDNVIETTFCIVKLSSATNTFEDIKKYLLNYFHSENPAKQLENHSWPYS